MKPTVALTMGDPAGIGPEIVHKALADESVRPLADWIVIGDRKPLEMIDPAGFDALFSGPGVTWRGTGALEEPMTSSLAASMPDAAGPVSNMSVSPPCSVSKARRRPWSPRR